MQLLCILRIYPMSGESDPGSDIPGKRCLCQMESISPVMVRVRYVQAWNITYTDAFTNCNEKATF